MTEMTRDYRGHTIKVTRFFEFEVPTIEGVPSFQTVKEAQKAIDNLIAAEERAQEREKKNPFKVQVLTTTGELTEMRGINANTQRIMGPKNYDNGYYPDVPWLREALKEKTRLKNRLVELENMVGHFVIHPVRGSGRVDAEIYLRRIEDLRKEHENKLFKAQARQKELQTEKFKTVGG